ncbi:MAG TPA: helix-turn-helix domain-containing protein, partial [Gemmatimonadota bacterium]|nr:helix-turn-helix domain-containing protein [Gemmatimonadota bacterium]
AGFDSAIPGGARQQDQIFTERAFKALCAYDWPGNVRELENVVERLLVLSGWRKGGEPGKRIDLPDLPDEIRVASWPTGANEALTKLTMEEEVEMAYIQWVLAKTEGNKARAAEILGIDPSTLYRKIDRYGLISS